MTRQFAVVQPGKAVWVTFLLAGAVLPVIVLALTWAFSDERWLASLRLPHLAGGIAVLVIAFGWIGLVLRRLRVEIVDGMLCVHAAFYTRKVALTELDSAAARILDLERGSEWLPRVRMNGVELPGVHIGHYRGQPFKRKQFCLVTSKRRVLLLPERAPNRFLLLSLERPQALIDALAQKRA